MIVKLFADGGMLKGNPSIYGGTYAWRCVNENDEPVTQGGGIILTLTAPLATSIEDVPQDALEVAAVGNNLIEMIAVIEAMQQVSTGWAGQLCSDSGVTLKRLTGEFQKWEGIPPQIKIQAQQLFLLRHITTELLSGHPNAEHLKSGIGPRGYPCSKHNVWCDKECQRLAKLYRKAIGF